MENFFRKKDKIILKTSALAVIDGLVSAIDNSINNGAPLFAIAWGLSKGIYGANIQLRQDRAIEFIEMIRVNRSVFTNEILKMEEFQDGFVYVFQKYLNERTSKKRKLIKDIFCGFVKDTDKEKFKLEKFIFIVEQITIEEIEVLKIFSDGTIREWLRSQFSERSEEELVEMERHPLNMIQLGDLILNKMKGFTEYKNIEYTHEVLEGLSNLGLLISGIESRYDSSPSTFIISKLGIEFSAFIRE